MGTLAALNPYFWKYRGRLALGILFVFLTNAFSVFAPVVIGEGINVLQDAYTGFLAPLAEGQPPSEVFDGTALDTPPTLGMLAEFTGLGIGDTPAPGSKAELIRFVSFIAGLQALLYMLAYLLKGIFSFMTRQTIIVMSRFIEYDLKESIYDQYQRLPVSFYKQHATGDLMNRISEDVSKVRMLSLIHI